MTFSRKQNLTDIGKVIKQQRVVSELTLRQLSVASGVSTSHLGRVERGERTPSAHTLRKIAKPLGFQEEALFIYAGYLSPQSSTAESETNIGKPDPYVASVLASEPVGIQRCAITILVILKLIAKQKLWR